jgi:hypothetical protein
MASFHNHREITYGILIALTIAACTIGGSFYLSYIPAYADRFIMSKDAAFKCLYRTDAFENILIGDFEGENARYFAAEWKADFTRWEEQFQVSGLVRDDCKITILSPEQAVKRKRRLDYEASGSPNLTR